MENVRVNIIEKDGKTHIYPHKTNNPKMPDKIILDGLIDHEKIQVKDNCKGLDECIKTNTNDYIRSSFWIDGAEDTSGKVIIKGNYVDNVYYFYGNPKEPKMDFVKKIEIDEWEEGKERPYYKKKEGYIEVFVDHFSGVGTTQSDPILISNSSQFSSIREDLGAHYRLEDNIDLGGNFEIIAPTSQDPFTGSLDFNGFYIHNFEINNDVGDYRTGIFGSTSTASFKKINVKNGFITSSSMYTGGFIGNMRSTNIEDGALIDNVVVQGNSYVGGFCGFNYSSDMEDIEVWGQVKAVYNEEDDINPQYVGGLCGMIDARFTRYVRRNRVYGSLEAVGGSFIRHLGGLIGRSYAYTPPTFGGAEGNIYHRTNYTFLSIFLDSFYIDGSVSISTSGGMIGSTYGNSYEAINTTNRYCTVSLTNNYINSTLNLSSNRFTGSFAGFQRSAVRPSGRGSTTRNYSILNINTDGSYFHPDEMDLELIPFGVSDDYNYYDYQALLLDEPINGSGFEGKTREQLQTQSTYQNWNFENTWTMNTRNGLPSFRWLQDEIHKDNPEYDYDDPEFDPDDEEWIFDDETSTPGGGDEYPEVVYVKNVHPEKYVITRTDDPNVIYKFKRIAINGNVYVYAIVDTDHELAGKKRITINGKKYAFMKVPQD